MWLFILCATGVGLACSCVAMVEVLSSLKYQCTNSDDSMVESAIVLDYIRAISGFILTAIVAYGYSVRHTLNAIGAYHANVSAVMCTILAVLFIGVVQQSEACMNCVVEDNESFTEDLRRMLGGSGCADRLQAANFKVADNYCKEQLGTLCTPTALGEVYAERCLVYGCSTLVHGVGFRYLLGIIGMTIQVAVCVVILTDRNTLFNKELGDSTDFGDLRAETERIRALSEQATTQFNELTEQTRTIRAQVETLIGQHASAPPESSVVNKFKPPPRPGLRLRPNVSTYSRLRQLDF